MKEKIVPSAWLEQDGRRLDCGPHLSGAMEAKLLLAKVSARKEPLQCLTRDGLDGIFHAGREGRTYVVDETHGVPFLGSTDILAADLSFVPLISKAQATATPKFAIERDWTLITRSGTVGRMAFARPDMHGMACSEHVLRVVPNQGKVLAGYLFAYLSGRFGVPLVVGSTYGSIIQHIEPEHIANLPVPRFGDGVESRAHEKVIEAAKLRSAYQNQIRAATSKLFASVGLEDITSGIWHSRSTDLGFTQKLGSSPASLRALNFNPRFLQLCDSIRARPHRSLGELCQRGTLSRGGWLKRVDAEPEHAYQLIGQKEIFWSRPEGRWIAKKFASEVVYPPGTVLVAATGTLGESELYCRAEFLWGIAASRAYAENFLRVAAVDAVIPSGCLFAFLRSETAFRMLRSVSTGTKLQIPNVPLLRKLPVPYPEEHFQHEIHEAVVDAYEKRERSVCAEDEAVALVESAIQGSG